MAQQTVTEVESLSDEQKLQLTRQIVHCETLDELRLALSLTLRADVTINDAASGPAASSRGIPEGRQLQADEDAPTRTLAAGNMQPATRKAMTALTQLQEALKKRGSHGILSLGLKFRSMDDDGSRHIDPQEFGKVLKESGLSLPPEGEAALFRYFDADCNGFLSFDEFLVGVKGSMTPRRRQMVQLAFNVFDKNGDGEVTMADMEGRYNGAAHPDVVAGVKTEAEVLREVLDQFDGGEKDGVISLEDFMAYYRGVSASVDDDDYFELVIRNAWHISGGEGWCANTTCKRVLVIHTDGSQTVEEVKDDFDMDPKDIPGLTAALESQGVTDIKSIALYGDMTEESGGDAPAPPPQSTAGGPASRPSTGATEMSETDRNRNRQRSSIMF